MEKWKIYIWFWLRCCELESAILFIAKHSASILSELLIRWSRMSEAFPKKYSTTTGTNVESLIPFNPTSVQSIIVSSRMVKSSLSWTESRHAHKINLWQLDKLNPDFIFRVFSSLLIFQFHTSKLPCVEKKHHIYNIFKRFLTRLRVHELSPYSWPWELFLGIWSGVPRVRGSTWKSPWLFLLTQSKFCVNLF